MIALCRNHSYEEETVTGKAKSPGKETPFSEDSETGMSWGRIIHKMLEAFVGEEGIDLISMAENLLREEERPLSERDSVIATLKAVTASDLWDRMKKAEIALAEIVIETGLFFADAGKWVVIRKNSFLLNTLTP